MGQQFACKRGVAESIIFVLPGAPQKIESYSAEKRTKIVGRKNPEKEQGARAQTGVVKKSQGENPSKPKKETIFRKE